MMSVLFRLNHVAKSQCQWYLTTLWLKAPITQKLCLNGKHLRLRSFSVLKCSSATWPQLLKTGGILLSAAFLRARNSQFDDVEPQISPIPQSKPQPNDLCWTVVLKLLMEDIVTILAAIAAAVLVAYLNVKVPLKLGEMINVLTSIMKSTGTQSVSQLLVTPSLNLLALYISQAIGTFVYISLLSGVGERLALKVRYRLFQAILSQDVAFFDSTRTGVLMDCLSSDVQEFKSAFKQSISQGLRSLTQITGAVISVFIISPKMTLTMITVVPVLILCGSMCGALLRALSFESQQQGLAATTMSEQTISNIRTVRAFAGEKSELNAYQCVLEKSCRLNILLGCGIGAFQGATNLFLNGLVLGTLCLGGHLLTQERISPGNLMSFLVSAQLIQKSFTQLSLLTGVIFKGKEAAERVFHFSNITPTIPIEGGEIISSDSFTPSVEFRDVSFSYPTRPGQKVLNNLSLRIPAGKTVAVVGSSGNGKSTIVALLERFYDPDSGSVLVSGVDIKKLDQSWLRGSVIGLISQEPVLFATSIKENIRYGKPGATDEEVYEAARLANAHEFITNFPQGYDTVVGERGVTVSGGQKQRIAIARALIKNPSILILDEATSALDAESEKHVQATLEDVTRGKTVLTIAHRLSTVKNAQLIIVLDKGAIKEAGTHGELLAQKGIYHSLMNLEGESPQMDNYDSVSVLDEIKSFLNRIGRFSG